MKEERHRSSVLNELDYFSGFYVLVSSLIGRIAYGYPIVPALAVAPNLFLAPYLVGIAIMCIFSRRFGGRSKSLKFLAGFLLGSLFLYCPIVLCSFFGYIVNMAVFDAVIIGLIAIGFLKDSLYRTSHANVRNVFSKSLRVIRPELPRAFEVLAILGIAVLAFYIPKIKVPFPLISYDHAVGLETIQPVTRLLNAGLLDVASTRALPVILSAVVCSLSSVPVSYLAWAAPLSTSLVFCISVFSLTYSVTKKRALAIASVLFAVFLFSGGSDLFFDCVYYIFRYSTIQTAVFPLAIQGAYLYFSKVKDEDKKKPLGFLFLGVVFFIGAFYVFEFLQPPFLTAVFSANEYLRPPLILIFLGLVLMCSTRIKNQTVKELVFFISLFTAFSISLDIFRPVLDVAFLFIFLFLLTQANTRVARSFQFTAARIKIRFREIPWSRRIVLLRTVAFVLLSWVVICMAGYVNIPDSSLIAGPWGLDTLTKLQSLIAANSVEVMIIFLAVSIPLIFSKNPCEFALAFLSLVGLTVYFLPLTELFYVAYNILNITIGFTIVVGLFKIVEHSIHAINIAKIKLKVPKSFKTLLGLSLCMIVVIPVIGASMAKFTWTGGADYRSVLTDYEEKAINEYIAKLPQDVRIISDPFTMIVFSSLSNRIGLVEHGIAPLTDQYKSASTVSTIWSIFHSDSSLGIHESIMNLQNVIPLDEQLYVQSTRTSLNLSRFMVIVSARTSWWLDNGDPLGYYTLFPWSYNVTLSHIIQFLDPSTFNLTYRIDGKIYIFIAGEGDNSPSYRVDTRYLSEEPQTPFWNVEYYSSGNLSIILSQINSSIDGTQLNNCVNVMATNGSYGQWGLYHAFGDFMNMSKYQLITLPFYGENTNSTYYFSLDGPTIHDRTIFLFKDNFEGWNSVFFSLNRPFATEGKPDLASVTRIYFSPYGTDSNYDRKLLLGPLTESVIDWYN